MKYSVNEIYKIALYLTLNHLESKVLVYNKQYFTLINDAKCKCIILNFNQETINMKYTNLFGECGFKTNDIKYYIFIRPLIQNPFFAYDFKYFIIETSMIKHLIIPCIRRYKEHIQNFIQSYYKFDYNVLKSSGKILKIY
jgi:hypothetical protein